MCSVAGYPKCLLVYQFNYKMFENVKSQYLFEFSNVCYHVQPSDFCSLFKIRHVMDQLIMTSIDHMEKKFSTFTGFELGNSRS